MKLTIYADGGHRTVEAAPGATVLQAIQDAGVPGLSAPCGGRGVCGKCRVFVRGGGEAGWRLACQTKAEDGMTISLSGDTRLTIAEAGACRIYPAEGGDGYALACDIGTTTVVMHLLRLNDGARLATVSGGNPQAVFGADVISRISACSAGKLDALTGMITGRLNAFIAALCRSAGVTAEELRFLAVAGNTVMDHLFAGLDPTSIGTAPFLPLSRFGDLRDADALGLAFSGSVYIVPCVAGYVGGDITAGLLAAGLPREETPVLFLDVGTNGEMALGFGDSFTCCAAAAGPAFEGAELECGMAAAPGAISEVRWQSGRLVYKTIDGEPAVGVCGSGLIDALAVMLDIGAVDETGRLLSPAEAPAGVSRCLTGDGRFLLTDDGSVYISAGDVRKLQLAKAAIAAGIALLLEDRGLLPVDLSGMVLAGGFGSHIRPESAARIGLFPRTLLPGVRAVGNAAGEGAVSAAVSGRAREALARLTEACRYLELSTHRGFSDVYMESMLFAGNEDYYGENADG